MIIDLGQFRRLSYRCWVSMQGVPVTDAKDIDVLEAGYRERQRQQDKARHYRPSRGHAPRVITHLNGQRPHHTNREPRRKGEGE